MAKIWRQLGPEKKLALLRRWRNGEKLGGLADEIGIQPQVLRQNLENLERNLGEEQKPRITLPPEKGLPTFDDLFNVLRKGPVTLGELSRRYDRSEATIMDLIEQMETAGYVIEKKKGKVQVNTAEHPRVEYKPARTLADEVGHEIVFAVASDSHAGSTHAQISARNKFIDIAYNEYGVRHIFDPGDLTAGVGGYRGQEIDMVPAIRPTSRFGMYRTTEAQVWLADAYTPHYDGLTYYELGGNHDYWHIMNTGIDAVSKFCKERDDAIFLGYDVADVPLTDRASLRLWHPTGGVPYALSYRLQKGMEQLAFDELSRAVELNENPKVRFLLAGHLHIEGKFHRGPMVAAQVGCFEGQTNYLKRKGLYPSIGGAIFRVRVTDSGNIQRVEYTFIPFYEVKDDWKNYPLPPAYDFVDEPDRTEVLFRME